MNASDYEDDQQFEWLSKSPRRTVRPAPLISVRCHYNDIDLPFYLFLHAVPMASARRSGTVSIWYKRRLFMTVLPSRTSPRENLHDPYSLWVFKIVKVCARDSIQRGCGALVALYQSTQLKWGRHRLCTAFARRKKHKRQRRKYPPSSWNKIGLGLNADDLPRLPKINIYICYSVYLDQWIHRGERRGRKVSGWAIVISPAALVNCTYMVVEQPGQHKRLARVLLPKHGE